MDVKRRVVVSTLVLALAGLGPLGPSPAPMLAEGVTPSIAFSYNFSFLNGGWSTPGVPETPFDRHHTAVSAIAGAASSENPDCYRCTREPNEPEEEGWKCTAGQEFCHWHHEDKSFFTNYHPMGHPKLVWLNGECHNSCDPPDQLVSAANAVASLLRSDPGRLSQALELLARKSILHRLESDGSLLVLLGTADCPQQLVVPIRVE